VVFQIVPVARACKAISAFPNGCFHGDLTPMEIFAVAPRFEERCRYELFGIGASYLGFLRRDDLPRPPRATSPKTSFRFTANASPPTSPPASRSCSAIPTSCS
jgi:hypothetical protein